ncbi:MAG: hypothetical protein FWF08_05225 [Oscillospiraceae bacterium]|nr:hypothetical protein [Oscillospiraceae bacterium]
MNTNIKKLLKSGFGLLMTLALLLTSVPLVGLQAHPAKAGAALDEAAAFETERQAFFEDVADNSSEFESLETIIIEDEPNIVDYPREEPEREAAPIKSLRSGIAAAPGDAGFAYGPFNHGDVRMFWIMIGPGNTRYASLPATLLAKGQHSNVWVLNDAEYHAAKGSGHTSSCALRDMTHEKANDIANIIDGIYERMTDGATGFAKHANVRISANSGYIGDIDNDGAVNFIFYPLNEFNYAGFFSPADFDTSGVSCRLDVLHMNINGILGSNPLYYYSILAHEFQHLLFYMYFDNFSSANNNFSWINESLADLASTYYLQPGAEVSVSERTSAASKNPYAAASGAYSDFVSFGALKGYGTGYMLSLLMQKKTGGSYAHDIYEYFKNTYPPSATLSEWNANRSLCTGKTMAEIWGDVVKSFGIGSGGINSFALMYQLFMESFAADGGVVRGDSADVSTVKLFSGNEQSENLWSLRNFNSYPLANGGTVDLGGYGSGSPRSNATHEKIYRISAGAAGDTVLNITVNDGGAGGDTKYYVALKRAGTAAALPNADIYPLTPGTAKTIYTNGKEAYLFAATLFRRANTTVSYTWSAPPANMITGTVELSAYTPRIGDTVTASAPGVAGTLSYAWTSGGEPAGTNSNNYTAAASDIGNVIKVSVTSSAYANGSLETQTVAVAKAINPLTASAPVLSDRTQTSITLSANTGYEYSNNAMLWQDSPDFINLLPGFSYRFYQRIKATGSTAASNVSSPLTVSTLPSAINSVIVAPSGAAVQNGGTKQFTATVTGPDNPPQSVVWSVSGANSGGSYIDGSGLLTVSAGETASLLTVTAASTADPSKYGTVTVTVALTPITSVNINIAAPVTGAIPGTAAAGAGNFTAGPVSWSPNDSSFKIETRYTASVTLTANPGYTFAGLSSATVNGQNADITNNGNTLVLSYQFEPTENLNFWQRILAFFMSLIESIRNLFTGGM